MEIAQKQEQDLMRQKAKIEEKRRE
jgi:hypothetical protein